MISVLTLTYNRRSLLEEAIQSFLAQEYYGCEYEMVIINDSVLSDYIYEHPRIRIINHKERFQSISTKIEFGYKQCKYNYIYRLDDDDLLAPWAMEVVHSDVVKDPGYDIYRSRGHYFFLNNKFIKIADNINNGNVYTKQYLDRIQFPNKTSNEDVDLTFNHNGKIFHHENTKKTMIYRWGTGHYHISGIGIGDDVLKKVDKQIKIDEGVIELKPKFITNYYDQLP